LAGVFDLDIGGQKFNGDENCSDFNDHRNTPEIQITIGWKDLLQIPLKYTGDYMEQGQKKSCDSVVTAFLLPAYTGRKGAAPQNKRAAKEGGGERPCSAGW
jgi:hypothetical protein